MTPVAELWVPRPQPHNPKQSFLRSASACLSRGFRSLWFEPCRSHARLAPSRAPAATRSRLQCLLKLQGKQITQDPVGAEGQSPQPISEPAVIALQCQGEWQPSEVTDGRQSEDRRHPHNAHGTSRPWERARRGKGREKETVTGTHAHSTPP